MIKNWNYGEVKAGEVFHFNHSLEPFIFVKDSEDDTWGGVFVNLNTYEIYHVGVLDLYGLEFYYKPDDPDYLGVRIDGHIEWVDAE